MAVLINCLLVLLFLLPFKSTSQSADRNIVLSHIQEQSTGKAEVSENNVFKKIGLRKRPYIILPAIFMLAYRTILTDQISTECLFDLSCSRFSMKAISEQGLIKGIWLTTDRLTRCNHNGHEETGIIWLNTYTGKLKDEPEMYR